MSKQKRQRGAARASRPARERHDVVQIQGADALLSRRHEVRLGAPERPRLDAFPYDSALLDELRAAWRVGDWATLTRVTREQLEHHPDRARLALLVAAGHQAHGQVAATREYAQLATRWGCDREVLARVLIAGVHNTLARASSATGNQRDRALRHFDAAVALGTPASAQRLATMSRIEQQLGQMGLTSELAALHLPRVQSGVASVAATMASPFQQLAAEAKRQTDSLAAEVRKQQADLAQTRKALEVSLKKEMLNATKQLEAFLGIQSYLAGGTPPPELHGWPVSPDFALYLIGLLEQFDYDAVVEFGSGSSTVLMAQALAKSCERRGRMVKPIQVAFEHLAEYHAQTTGMLSRAGFADDAQVVHAPLIDYRAPDGVVYAYYDCVDTLHRLRQSLACDEPNVLVVVDGPPATTGKHARYPALPVLLAHLPGAQLDIVLDDYARADEKEIAQLWLAEIAAHGLACTIVEKSLEKDACTLSIRKRSTVQSGQKNT